jgi:ATP-dependent Clp protease ATP-binding subunit ClpC
MAFVRWAGNNHFSRVNDAMDEVVPMTDRARAVLQLAENAAREYGHFTVEPEHLLMALVNEGEGLAAHALRNLGVDRKSMKHLPLNRLSSDTSDDVRPVPSDAFNQLQTWAADELLPLGHNYVGTEHLLLALTRVASLRNVELMAALSLDADIVRREVYGILGHLE